MNKIILSRSDDETYKMILQDEQDAKNWSLLWQVGPHLRAKLDPDTFERILEDAIVELNRRTALLNRLSSAVRHDWLDSVVDELLADNERLEIRL